MATISDFFPSNYLKCADLAGKERVVTIAFVKEDVFENEGKKQKKPVIYFKDAGVKPMVCNKTNFLTIENSCGKDTDDWVDKKIVLYPEMVSFRGKVSEAVRVKRVPVQAAAELNDAIPF
jgi:hypothetical protein